MENTSNHKRRIEELREDWLVAKQKGKTGLMKFIETLAKAHKSRILSQPDSAHDEFEASLQDEPNHK